MRIRTFSSLLIFLVLLAACGSSTTGEQGNTTTSVPAPTHVPPTPKKALPTRTQVDELAYSIASPTIKVESYDAKTGVLVVSTEAGTSIVRLQDNLKNIMESVHNHFWEADLDFASITVVIYAADDHRKVAYSTLIARTASTINWHAVFGHAPLWNKYDEKWIDPRANAE